mmetsp:Transcript_122821/g.393451  ORF Transcript_122821/g.393451 Transcript_122821/m.393451 type:complete len:261 (-) Transcript_122821:23-805(-)
MARASVRTGDAVCCDAITKSPSSSPMSSTRAPARPKVAPRRRRPPSKAREVQNWSSGRNLPDSRFTCLRKNCLVAPLGGRPTRALQEALLLGLASSCGSSGSCFHPRSAHLFSAPAAAAASPSPPSSPSPAPAQRSLPASEMAEGSAMAWLQLPHSSKRSRKHVRKRFPLWGSCTAPASLPCATGHPASEGAPSVGAASATSSAEHCVDGVPPARLRSRSSPASPDPGFKAAVGVPGTFSGKNTSSDSTFASMWTGAGRE